ncbi:MAG: hypothetical protein HYS07_08330 [Chlamydiae bacterium]|nr:hypothetical protein [Chlamydiota bacterium]MBI3276612.1 hypothetical protein [Chlamydiota bacterium]
MGSDNSKILILILFIFFLQVIPTFADHRSKLNIYFTGEEKGRLEPCGCQTEQLGGLSRRHFFLQHVVAPGKLSFLLSNGDLIGGALRQDELKFETTLQAMNVMGYGVLNLGEEECLLGLETLQSMESLAHFPFLSSNVVDQLGNPIFRSVISKDIDINGIIYKVKILGVLSLKFQQVIASRLFIKSPQEAIQGFFQKEEDSHLFWILLYHGDIEEAIEIAKLFPQLNLIIAGHGKEDPPHQPIWVGQTILVSEAVGGKWIGEMHFLFDEKGKGNFENLKFIPLDDQVKSSEDIKKIMDEYQSRLKDEALYKKEEGRMKGGGQTFVGSQVCQSCHQNAFHVWENSRHWHAYESLLPIHHPFDPDCLVCHSVGFRYEGGFKGKELTSSLAFVGCESCHGGGLLHVLSPMIQPMNRSGEGTCITCHDSENSPQFDFEKYWEKIKH